MCYIFKEEVGNNECLFVIVPLSLFLHYNENKQMP